MYTPTILSLLMILATSALAVPFPSGTIAAEHFEVLDMRASETVDPNAVKGTVCTNTSTNIVFHDQNVALLGICGGIAGKITKCQGAPTSTSGSSGTALFELNPTVSGATINVSKGRWEGCVRAARAVCPKGDLKSTCIGGASTGNVAFTLKAQ